jgi:hypothetical protein
MQPLDRDVKHSKRRIDAMNLNNDKVGEYCKYIELALNLTLSSFFCCCKMIIDIKSLTQEQAAITETVCVCVCVGFGMGCAYLFPNEAAIFFFPN